MSQHSFHVTSIALVLALSSGFESYSYVHLCLVYGTFPYSGSFVLAVASCGVNFRSDTYVYQYLCANGLEKLCTLDTDLICSSKLITRIKLLAFATLSLGSALTLQT